MKHGLNKAEENHETDLAPCPHCGKKDVEFQSSVSITGSWANVFCSNCRSTGPTIDFRKLTSLHQIAQAEETIRSEAINAWNHRVQGGGEKQDLANRLAEVVANEFAKGDPEATDQNFDTIYQCYLRPMLAALEGSSAKPETLSPQTNVVSDQ